MHVLCIASSQVEGRGTSSFSYHTCSMIKNIIQQVDATTTVEITLLSEKVLKPCIMCAECKDTGLCIFQDDFNELFAKIKAADIVFWVVPYYAGLPSRATIILEKMREIMFIESMLGNINSWPLIGKLSGIIVQGGFETEDMALGEPAVLKPMATVLSSLGFSLKDSEQYDNGVMFGVKGYNYNPQNLFPEFIYDWDKIEEILEPYVTQYL